MNGLFRKPELHSRIVAWAVSHARAFFFSLGKIYRAPVASIMTIAVLGIALALPSGLYLLLNNIEQATAGWDHGARVSLFLEKDMTEQNQKALADKILLRPEVIKVERISADQALAEFKQHSGFGAALDALDDNPLPPVLVVYPDYEGTGLKAMEVLIDNLGRTRGIEEVVLDMRWLQRLQAIMETTRRTVFVIAGMLALTVILVVGNTIRLDIQNRRQEIEVAKLIGATDAFIRRPFLYGGLWYGLIGSLLGIITVQGALALLQGPVESLAGLYGSEFALLGLNTNEITWVFASGTLLGWLGSWIAVGRHIKDIEPT
jgi:cell division transport system permease protein